MLIQKKFSDLLPLFFRYRNRILVDAQRGSTPMICFEWVSLPRSGRHILHEDRSGGVWVSLKTLCQELNIRLDNQKRRGTAITQVIHVLRVRGSRERGGSTPTIEPLIPLEGLFSWAGSVELRKRLRAVRLAEEIEAEVIGPASPTRVIEIQRTLWMAAKRARGGRPRSRPHPEVGRFGIG